MSEEHLFVYGTLRRGPTRAWNQLLNQYADFAGKATYQGKMYRVDYYPGVVRSDEQGDLVHGEVYRLIEPVILLRKLDEYEACSEAFPEPWEFIRQKAEVRLRDNTFLEAWLYIYNQSIEGLEWIESGDFLKMKIP